MIPYGRQSITEADVAAVSAVLHSNFLTQGPAVPAFEVAVRDRVGALHAVAVNSATSALHIACLALGVGAGDRVWTSPVTFVASANCALYCGATVDFVDIDPLTYNMSVEQLARKLAIAKVEGALPKVVIPVHLAGQSCDMMRIAALASEYGFAVIEDASHAIGGDYDGRPIGDCRFSDITIFSFHPVKIITTAEGGLATTRDAALAHRMSLLRSHGVTRDVTSMRDASHGPWYYEQIDLGFNYRMTDMQAALGLSQMSRLDAFIAERRRLAERYFELLDGMPLILPRQDQKANSAWHLYIIRVDGDEVESKHRIIFEYLRSHGIGVNLHYMPVYLQPYYRDLGFPAGYCPVAESYYRSAISIPLFADLGNRGQEDVVAHLRDALAA